MTNTDHPSSILGRALSCALLLCIVAHPLTLQAAPVDIDRIVAIVDNDIIAQTELTEQMRTVKAQLREQRIPPPPDRVLERQVLERMVLEQIQLQLAEEIGVFVDDDALNQAISGIAAQNNLSLSDFRNVLQREGYDFVSFRENIRNEMILVRLRQQHVDNRITITEQEVDNFLATQRRQGQGNEEYHLGHILIALPEAAAPDQFEQAQERAQAVVDDLKGGADFSQTAITSSDGQQALSGGDLGWRKTGELPTLFADIVPQMQSGEISDLIRTSSGFHIVKLIDKRSGDRKVVSQTRARHILIETDAITTDELAIESMQEIRNRLLAGENFAELARAFSDDLASASAGGDLGWVEPGEMIPGFERAMDALEPGEISEPVNTEFGWHVIQVLDRRKHDITEDSSRDMAREAIFRRKAEEGHTDWLRRLREDAYVEYRL